MAYIVVDSNLPASIDSSVSALAENALKPIIDAAIAVGIPHESLTLTLSVEDSNRNRRNISAVIYPQE